MTVVVSVKNLVTVSDTPVAAEHPAKPWGCRSDTRHSSTPPVLESAHELILGLESTTLPLLSQCGVGSPFLLVEGLHANAAPFLLVACQCFHHLCDFFRLRRREVERNALQLYYQAWADRNRKS